MVELANRRRDATHARRADGRQTQGDIVLTEGAADTAGVVVERAAGGKSAVRTTTVAYEKRRRW